MAKEIDIKLKTTYDGKGGDQAKKHLNGIADGFAKIGEALGGANSNLGRFMQNFLKGGIWGAAAELVGYGIKKIYEWFTASERAEKEAAKAAKEAHTERMKCLDEYSAAIDKLAQKRTATINQNLKALNDELDATKELTKATLELEKAEARKRGDTGRMAELDREMDAVDVEAARIKLEQQLEASKKRTDSEKKNIYSYEVGRSRATLDARDTQSIIDSKLKSIADKAARSAKGEAVMMNSSAGSYITYAAASEEDKKRAASLAIEAYKKTEEYKTLSQSLNDAKKKADEFKEKIDASKTAIKAASDEEKNLLTRLETINVKEEAKLKNAEAIQIEEAKKAEEKRIADVKAAELKAAAEAAKERERLDREAHKKRMDDIRAEIAASAGRGNILKATAADAQNEFDRAFAMYRDPTHAASVIGEEKDYRNDLNRLHKDAARYGGKWRIDELSRLMAAGDNQGVSDALNSWRKSKSFTPEVEAMVRASAAERTKTTAEEELRKIQHNTANLDKKLDELLSMKG